MCMETIMAHASTALFEQLRRPILARRSNSADEAPNLWIQSLTHKHIRSQWAAWWRYGNLSQEKQLLLQHLLRQWLDLGSKRKTATPTPPQLK